MSSRTPIRQRAGPHPFLLSVEDVAQQLQTSIETGLTALRVQELQRTYPLNELQGGGGVTWYKILFKQMCNAMLLVNLSNSIFETPTNLVIDPRVGNGREFWIQGLC